MSMVATCLGAGLSKALSMKRMSRGWSPMDHDKSRIVPMRPHKIVLILRLLHQAVPDEAFVISS